ESDNGIETDYKLDPQIESLIQNNYQYLENFSESESELSDLHLDDLAYTHKQKKGKFKSVDDFQATIQANHQEFLNNNSKRIHDSEEYLIN
ncbi:14520_t:CDS:2, partial [Dentiscutata erythropus]